MKKDVTNKHGLFLIFLMSIGLVAAHDNFIFC